MNTWSIGAKLALQITLAIVIVMATVGVLGMYQQEQKFTDILDTRAEWITQQCAWHSWYRYGRWTTTKSAACCNPSSPTPISSPSS